MARKILPKHSTHRDTTPKIIYLIGLLAYVFWGAWGYILFNFPPDNIRNRLFFLGALFAAFFREQRRICARPSKTRDCN